MKNTLMEAIITSTMAEHEVHDLCNFGFIQIKVVLDKDDTIQRSKIQALKEFGYDVTHFVEVFDSFVEAKKFLTRDVAHNFMDDTVRLERGEYATEAKIFADYESALTK